ncbi:phosphotransferase family protein [Ruegeria profundi]|uniref:phosphotransferase family protein n=1 Tax=Ruegeria profundi TaxID=1685378 RepID=UPI001CD79305|nr:aminoglycoside phosphotransferase family protein [Ruegeria profundi]MCA0929353.1 aminoglycoside phosphotransferase family protein [Ruegeria profundi]
MIPLPDPNSPPIQLVAQLRDQGLIAAETQFQAMYGGRTNQVWKVIGENGGRVLKLYRAGLRNPLFRNDGELEAQCLTFLEPTGFVPRLRATGQHQDDRWVFYDHAPGSPWRDGVAPVAELLGKLHQLDLQIQAPKGCNGSMDLARHGQSILDRCRSDMRQKIEALRPDDHIPPTHHTCLIHGDPVAGNILVAPSGLTLIDWQCPAQGDPCEDLALFLSPAMQHLYRGKALTLTEESLFLSAYGCANAVKRYKSLRRWYAWRMAAYCLWQIENGGSDYSVGLELERAALPSSPI